MKRFGNISAALAMTSLAIGSAAHAANAPAAAPQVPGGEMGCMVVLGLATMATDKVVDQQKDEADKQAVRDAGKHFGMAGDWFMARVSTWPEASRDKKAFEDAFGKVKALDNAAMAEMLKTCDQWYMDNRHATLDLFKGS